MSQEDRQRIARKISALLAKAESSEFEGERDALLEKATALQLQYVIDEAMLGDQRKTSEKVISKIFCEEKFAPLVKARRELINILALYNRGKAILIGRREYVQVLAHETDMDLISGMYNSLVLHLHTTMLQDEREIPSTAMKGWRVSYAHSYVQRINERLAEIKERSERKMSQKKPGSELVLADRSRTVLDQFQEMFPGARKLRYRVNAGTNRLGEQAGWQAGGTADLGQTRVSSERNQEIRG